MILSIGEVVWDIFPDRRVLGGAPVNVAYHLRCLGVEVGVVTRVGADELGDRTIGTMAALGLPVTGVQRGELPTGRVTVTMGADHEPSFEIVTPAAWDNIDLAAAESFIAGRPFKLVFGTLAQRDERSRRAIRGLWAKAEQRFYDVNLRPPHTSREIVEESLAAADLVKVNGAELRALGRWRKLPGRYKAELSSWSARTRLMPLWYKKAIAREVMGRYNIAVLVVTEGAEGAWLMAGEHYFHAPGCPVKVVDTVGAGDAFFATLLAGHEHGLGWQECLDRATARGGYVASRHGATPPMPAL
jgi:fructokinase